MQLLEKILEERRRHEKVFKIVFCNWVVFSAPQQLGLLASKKHAPICKLSKA